VPVYDRRYRGYEGTLRPPRAAIATLLRYGLQEAFSSRLTLVLFIASCLPVLVFASVIYLANNLEVLVQAGIRVGEDFPRIRDAAFFFFLTMQSGFAFLLAAFVGPTLVAPDVAHGAMPLYLSRPLSRWGYGLGKLSVLLVLLSLVTWLPGMLLVLLQASLGVDGWLAQHWDLLGAVFLAAWIWILPVSLAALAISAWVRWRPLATAMLFVVFMVLQGFGHAVNGFLGTRWGTLLILSDLIKTIWLHLFHADQILPESVVRALLANPLPLAVCWAAVGAACALAAWLFGLRIRAQETVR
jgi:ABC-2 type transport system permease protein